MFFRVNGAAVYARGGNKVPMDLLGTKRIQKQKQQKQKQKQKLKIEKTQQKQKIEKTENRIENRNIN